MLPLVGPARRRRALFASREMAIKAYRGRGAFRGWSDEMLTDYVRSGLIENGDGQFRLACPPHWESAAYARFPFGMANLGKLVYLPVTILMGARGSSTDRRVVQKISKHHGNMKIAYVPGTTHFLPMEAPEVLREAIIASSRA
jgi:pimeloyl-ACP methyl ester carboxylesterase